MGLIPALLLKSLFNHHGLNSIYFQSCSMGFHKTPLPTSWVWFPHSSNSSITGLIPTLFQCQHHGFVFYMLPTPITWARCNGFDSHMIPIQTSWVRFSCWWKFIPFQKFRVHFNFHMFPIPVSSLLLIPTSWVWSSTQLWNHYGFDFNILPVKTSLVQFPCWWKFLLFQDCVFLLESYKPPISISWL